MIVHVSSSTSEPWMSAPTSFGLRRRYLIVKNTTTSATTSTTKNALTPVMNRYSRSISVATEEALGGNRGNELDI